MAYFVRFCFSVIVVCNILSETQQYVFRESQAASPPILPFPTCRAEEIDCLRRGIRTFLILMNSGYFGMKPIDPVIINSVAISLPEEKMSFLLRNVNVIGAKWTDLHSRSFNLEGGRSGVVFVSDFHITGELSMLLGGNVNPYTAYMTMDIHQVETNVTYAVDGRRRNNDDYIIVSQERIIPRNSRLPTYFLQPNSEETAAIQQILDLKPSIVDHLSDEITTAVMHILVDNFKLFSSKVPVRYYYNY
ncbi:uncharacterized protein LOC115441942 [Manduca sexta]|uniref:uncharacterized protein LOC115441942 n=1 Tax=Manduca sexta TaxID=7130 RepID=UPI001890585C|nr:uncharacterized protein LOC115441942 [Manduca sexta]